MRLEETLNPGTVLLLAERGVAAATNFALAVLILIVGLAVAGLVKRIVRRASRRSPRFDATLASFFASLAYYSVAAVVAIAVLARFGVQTASLVAAFGAATLATGLALQGTLSNLAAGVMLIAFRPYSIGDWVEVGGVSGVVKDVTLFTTQLATDDNKQVIIPNGKVWGGIITNYSNNPTRRIEMTFTIHYAEDIERAMAVIKETLRRDDRVLAVPDIVTAVTGLSDASADILTRFWVATEDSWDVRYEAARAVKETLDRSGISIPYPHKPDTAAER